MKKMFFAMMAVVAIACTMISCNHNTPNDPDPANPVDVRDTADITISIYTHVSALSFMDITLHYTDPNGKEQAILLNEQAFLPANKETDGGKAAYSLIGMNASEVNVDDIFSGVKYFSFTQPKVTNWTTAAYYTLTPKETYLSDAAECHIISVATMDIEPQTAVFNQYDFDVRQHAFIGIETQPETINGMCETLSGNIKAFNLALTTGTKR